MKKLLIILLVVCFFMGCEKNEIETINRDSNQNVVNIIMTISGYGDGTIYEDSSFENPIKKDVNKVLSVVDVVVKDLKIESYKVYLGEEQYGYAKQNEFYIVELLSDDYLYLMTPSVRVNDLPLYEEVNPNDVVYSPFKYELYINNQLVKDNLYFETKKNYSFFVIAYDQIGRQFTGENVSFRSSKEVAPCIVYDKITEDKKAIKEYFLLDDYQDKIMDYVISYKDGEFLSYYTIQEEDAIGYILDEIPKISLHQRVLVQLDTTLQFENVMVFKDKNNGFLSLTASESHESTLINMETNAMIFYKGSYHYVYHDSWHEAFILTAGKGKTDKSLLEIFKADNLQLLSATTTEYFDLDNFEVNDDGIDFELNRNQFKYWPSQLNASIPLTAKFYKENTDYIISVLDQSTHTEPILKDVPLYEINGEKSRILATFNSDEIKSVSTSKIIDIQDGKVVYWFHLVTKDGLEGYAYRPAFDFEEIELKNGMNYSIRTKENTFIPIADLMPSTYFTIVLNNDLAGEFKYSYKNKDHYEYNTYYFDLNDMTVKIYEKPENKWSNESVITYYEEFANLEKQVTEVTFYDHQLMPSMKVTVDKGYLYDFIWIDANTISCYLQGVKYDYFYFNEPCVFRKINGEWALECKEKNYKIEQL